MTIEIYEGGELVAARYWFPKKDNPEEQEPYFDESMALAYLLAAEVVFVNSYWSKHWKFATDETGKLVRNEDGTAKRVRKEDASWTAEEAEMISFHVLCNDVFAWGYADAEDLPYNEIENLYDLWLKDPVWGPAIWCIKKRNQMPQALVARAIEGAGIWNLQEMELEANVYDTYLESKRG